MKPKVTITIVIGTVISLLFLKYLKVSHYRYGTGSPIPIYVEIYTK